MRAPDGSVTHTTFGTTEPDSAGNVPWDSGLTRSAISPDGTKTENLWERNIPNGCTSSWGTCANAHPDNPYVKTSFTSIKDSSGSYTLTAIKDFTHDKNGNVTEVKEYDFVPYSSVPRTNGRPTGLPWNAESYLKRITRTEVYNATPEASSTDYSDPDVYIHTSSKRLLRLQWRTTVLDASEVTKAVSEITYDHTNYDSSNTKGGNPTITRQWDSTKGPVSNPLTCGSSGNAVCSSATYNDYGMPLTTTDPNDVISTIMYGSVTTPTGTVSDLYPTQTVTASNHASVKRTSTAVYDFHTGLATTATDADNNISVVTEHDPLGRPTKVRNAANTPLESWTRTEYNDAGRFIVVRSDLAEKGDGKKVATQFYDQLGRVRLSKTLENSATQSATNETDGIKVQTRYLSTYISPNGYTYQLTSNPYRAGYSSNETADTMGWTRSKAWHTGKKQEVETFSGSAPPAPWGGNSASTGKVVTDIDANATTVTDQAGKQRRSLTNALGQLIRIDEPDSNNQLGSVTSPNQPTNYEYSTLGKMVHVEQGAQHRYFMYSSLGRLLRVRQPEQDINIGLNTSGNPGNNSWTAGFTYDDNGNVLTATDAKGTTITNTYDVLNRPLTRTYSDGTPPVANSYDGSGMSPVPSFSKGKLTKVTSIVSESRYTDFDEAGRLTEFLQITDGQTYTSSYEYNLSRALIKETYPSGRVVENEFDANGDLSKIFGKATPISTERTYANNFTYTPDGKIERLKLGSGVWESAKFNSRLQVTELSVGWGPSSGSIWKMTTEYGELQTNGTVDATKNSGNVGKQTVTFDGLAHPFVQAFTYDPLQRLTEAKETVNGTQTWREVFGYDRYGNRTGHNKFIGTGEVPQTDETHPEIDDATNRFEATEGYTFDANGNVIVDTTGRQFTFNGDNKQTEVKDAQNRLVGKYFYDGEGKRVKKLTYDEFGDPKDVTVFVYSAGKLIAEYSTEAPPQNPTTRFTVTDQLGSPRVILDSAGDVVSRRDFLPFGEEIDPDGTYRTTTRKYGELDRVRQKFTGYQHDGETGLDFAEARMYENRHGRFTAVDPLLASGKSADPQTFNRYVYVINNPLVLTDPTGLQAGSPSEENFDDPNRPADYVVNSPASRSFWSRIKDGFNQLVRSFIGDRGVEFRDAEADFAERKSTGPDKRVANAISNSADALNIVNDAVGEYEPTGIFNAQKAVVNNSLGRASDQEVYSAMGNAAINTAMTVYTPGKAFKAAQEGGKHAGFLKNYLSAGVNQLNKAIESLTAGKRGLNVHLDKIANPTKYVDDWNKLTKEHQQRILNNWEREVNNAREQIEILGEILAGK